MLTLRTIHTSQTNIRENLGEIELLAPDIITSEAVFQQPIRENLGEIEIILPSGSPDIYDSDVVLSVYGCTPVDTKGSVVSGSFNPNFSSNALSFPGFTTSRISYANSTALQLTNIFTVELFCPPFTWYNNSDRIGAVFLAKGQLGQATSGYGFLYYNYALQFLISDGIASTSHIWSFTPDNSTNYYLRVVKSGGTISLAINGVSQGSQPCISTLTTSSAPLDVGADPVNAPGTLLLRGIKITKGVARPLVEVPTVVVVNNWY